MEQSRSETVHPAITELRLPSLTHRVKQATRAQFRQPTPGRWFLGRPRLHGHLDLGTMGRLTTIVAPAGYGKTSLVSDWVATHAPKARWITLESGSNDLHAFALDIIHAVSDTFPVSGNSAHALITSTPHPTPAGIAHALANDLADIDTPLLLVLDDFQEISHAAALELFHHLLHVNGLNLHFIVCSREQLPLPLASLRAHGQHLDIDTDALSFTRSELAEFLTIVQGAEPSNDLVDTWWEQSEGWIAVIQLSALSLATTANTTSTRTIFRRAEVSASEFIGIDLLARLPPSLRAFLLIVSLPAIISPQLAASLIDGRLPGTDTSALLEEIMSRGLFLSRLDQDGRWYRFHPLFRQVLTAQLLETYGQGQVTVLHLGAATWFAQHSRIDRAIDHLLLAGDRAGAANLVLMHSQSCLAEDRWVELDGWLRRLPSDLVESNVQLLVAKAMVAQVRGAFDIVAECVERATWLLTWQNDSDDPLKPLLEAEVDLLRSFILQAKSADDESLPNLVVGAFATLRGSARYGELIALPMYALAMGQIDPSRAQREIDDYLAAYLHSDEDNQIATLRQAWGLLAHIFLTRHVGNIDRLHQLAGSMLRVAESAELRRLASQAHFYLGFVAWERNLLSEAILHFQAVVDEPNTGIIFHVSAACQLAESLDLMGDRAGAKEVITTYLDRIRDGSADILRPRLQRSLARMALRRNETPSDLAIIQHSLRLQSSWAIRTAETASFDHLAPLLQSDNLQDLDRARDIVTDIAESARANHLAAHLIYCDIVSAWIDHRQGRDEEAHHRLVTPLQDASKLGRLRSVAGVGTFVGPLLEWHVQAGFGTQYLATLLEVIEQDRSLLERSLRASPVGTRNFSPTQATLKEPLTNREIDILLGLQRRLSNKEIGDELSISPLTVKSHTRSIYAKLGVQNRRAAIARAYELGIFDWSPPVSRDARVD